MRRHIGGDLDLNPADEIEMRSSFTSTRLIANAPSESLLFKRWNELLLLPLQWLTPRHTAIAVKHTIPHAVMALIVLASNHACGFVCQLRHASLCSR